MKTTLRTAVLLTLTFGLAASALAAESPDGSTLAPDQIGGLSNSIHTSCATAVVVGLEWVPELFAYDYLVERDGTELTKTGLNSYADQTVEASTTYTYTISALTERGHVLSKRSLNVTTAEASPLGDAAVCQSKVFSGMTWNWSTGFNQQDNSDLWPTTWGADDNTYFFWGDGPGFFGSLPADDPDKVSYGFAELTATPPSPGVTPVLTTIDAINVYGGINAQHPASVGGKVNDIIAIGSNFYGLGGIWQPSDGSRTGPTKDNAPNHVEVVYSLGNAYSWQSNYSNWIFCSDQTSPTGFCAAAFVQFGKGYESPYDRYVYILGATEENFIGNGGSCNCTYMARVPSDQLLTKASYEVYAGTDEWGNPIWNSDWSTMQPIFIDNGANPMTLFKMVYNSSLRRFIAMGQSASVNQAAFYDAPNPWGPFTTIAYYPSNLDHTGGWGNLGSTAFTGGHGDSLGVNFINKWTSWDGLTMWATFSSDGTAGPDADLTSLAGKSMDSFSLVSATLKLR